MEGMRWPQRWSGDGERQCEWFDGYQSGLHCRLYGDGRPVQRKTRVQVVRNNIVLHTSEIRTSSAGTT
jgi:hypothetical protein